MEDPHNGGGSQTGHPRCGAHPSANECCHPQRSSGYELPNSDSPLCRGRGRLAFKNCPTFGTRTRPFVCLHKQSSLGDTTIDHRFLRVQYVARQMAPFTHTEREVASRRDRLYQYRLSPPPLTTRIESISFPEWGQPSHADDPDYFRLQDLQEFESTYFQTSLMHARFGQVGTPRHGERIQSDRSSVNEPAGRPRLDTASILDLIPQVWSYHPSLADVTHRL